MAQRPPAASAFTETASAAAWKTKPSWALVAGADQAINPEVERFGAERAGATIVEIEAPRTPWPCPGPRMSPN